MTILVGFPPKGRGKAVLSLAAMLSRSSGEPLVVCTVVPAPVVPRLSRMTPNPASKSSLTGRSPRPARSCPRTSQRISSWCGPGRWQVVCCRPRRPTT
jgi:hypothetical protein